MSYVFSKALQQKTGNEQTSNTRKWSISKSMDPPPEPVNRSQPTNSSQPENVSGSLDKMPPLVSRKQSAEHEEKAKSSEKVEKNVAYRRAQSLDFGTGPKMGGTFARLQENLQQEDNTPKSSIYSDAYNQYRIKRSLKEHGCLPKDVQENERLRKLGTNKAPPVVLPKTSRSKSVDLPSRPLPYSFRSGSSVDKTSNANRKCSDTIKEPIREEESEDAHSSPDKLVTNVNDSNSLTTNINSKEQNQDETMSCVTSQKDVISQEKPVNEEVINENSKMIETSLQEDENEGKKNADEKQEKENENTNNCLSNDSKTGTELSLPPLAPPEVKAMKDGVDVKKSQAEEGLRKLSDAIDELESISFDDIDKSCIEEEPSTTNQKDLDEVFENSNHNEAPSKMNSTEDNDSKVTEENHNIKDDNCNTNASIPEEMNSTAKLSDSVSSTLVEKDSKEISIILSEESQAMSKESENNDIDDIELNAQPGKESINAEVQFDKENEKDIEEMRKLKSNRDLVSSSLIKEINDISKSIIETVNNETHNNDNDVMNNANSSIPEETKLAEDVKDLNSTAVVSDETYVAEKDSNEISMVLSKESQPMSKESENNDIIDVETNAQSVVESINTEARIEEGYENGSQDISKVKSNRDLVSSSLIEEINDIGKSIIETVNNQTHNDNNGSVNEKDSLENDSQDFETPVSDTCNTIEDKDLNNNNESNVQPVDTAL